MSKSIPFYKTLRLIFLLFSLYTILAWVVLVFFGGAIDFPCDAYYDDVNSCLVAQRSADNNDTTNYQIESFLSVYVAGWSGGGCNHNYSNTNNLIIGNPVTGLKLERADRNLTVNGKVLEKGGTFEKVNIFSANPWIISQIKFSNIGLVSDCSQPSQSQRIVIVGDYRTETSFLKGSLILFVAIIGFVFTNNKIKQAQNLNFPAMKDIYYIRNILDNRLSNSNDKIVLDLLKRSVKLGASMDDLKELAFEADNWSAWHTSMEVYIQRLSNLEKSKNSSTGI